MILVRNYSVPNVTYPFVNIRNGIVVKVRKQYEKSFKIIFEASLIMRVKCANTYKGIGANSISQAVHWETWISDRNASRV